MNDLYKFTGKERDNESNLDYFGARYYESTSGRWLSVDPLRDKYPGWSGYNYVMDNPINLVDSTGTEPGGGDDPSIFVTQYVQGEYNSLRNTGGNIISDFKYNKLPSILDKASLATALPLPGLSIVASILSSELNTEKDIKDNKGITTKSLISGTTTAIGGSQIKLISVSASAIQFIFDELKDDNKNNTKGKDEEAQQQRDKKTIKTLRQLKELVNPISTYQKNNE